MQFATEEACVKYLIQSRWGDGFSCPSCQHGEYWYLPKRKLLVCRSCRKETSPTAGTLMHRSHIPIQEWFWAAYLVTTLSGNPAHPPDFFKENVIFEDCPSEIFQPEISAAIQNEILAKGIPALSGLTGRQSVSIRDRSGNLLSGRNIDMADVERPNGW